MRYHKNAPYTLNLAPCQLRTALSVDHPYVAKTALIHQGMDSTRTLNVSEKSLAADIISPASWVRPPFFVGPAHPTDAQIWPIWRPRQHLEIFMFFKPCVVQLNSETLLILYQLYSTALSYMLTHISLISFSFCSRDNTTLHPSLISIKELKYHQITKVRCEIISL